MWTTIALVVWILGCGLCSLGVDFIWKGGGDLDIVEVAAVVSMWPIFMVMIILFMIAVPVYGWWVLTKRMWHCLVRICKTFDLDEDS